MFAMTRCTFTATNTDFKRKCFPCSTLIEWSAVLQQQNQLCIDNTASGLCVSKTRGKFAACKSGLWHQNLLFAFVAPPQKKKKERKKRQFIEPCQIGFSLAKMLSVVAASNVRLLQSAHLQLETLVCITDRIRQTISGILMLPRRVWSIEISGTG